VARRTPPCSTDLCDQPCRRHPLRFISNREENGGLGPIRLGERQLPISNDTGVLFGFMAISKRNNTSSLNGSRCAVWEGKKLGPLRQARPRQVDSRAAYLRDLEEAAGGRTLYPS